MRSFFFSSRRRHTRSLRDWSSDVCSSDLAPWKRYFGANAPRVERLHKAPYLIFSTELGTKLFRTSLLRRYALRTGHGPGFEDEIGRASCRERVQTSVVAASVKNRTCDHST